MQTFEVEVKALLGDAERADEVRLRMKKVDPSSTMHSKNKQLNHYFEKGSLEKLLKAVSSHLSKDAQKKFKTLAESAQSFSVRTRDKDGEVFLVVKASVGSDTSENGVARMEFEEKVPLTLEELDALVLKSGFEYQAKWSREREEYVCRGTNVTLDKNAGYGWLAEFERMVDNENALAPARTAIDELMRELGIKELAQSRLERMFAHYNKHWPEYYGTDKIFVIE